MAKYLKKTAEHRKSFVLPLFYCAVISSPRPLIHSAIEARDAPPSSRVPESHVAPSVKRSRFTAPEPTPLPPEVQNGTTVLPEKS